MYKQYLIIFAIIGLSLNMFAQPSLDIEPRRVTFENIFNRYDYTNLINKGNQVLRIDSLSLTKSFYIIDFENAQQLPLFINPDDTVKVNITLTNFYNITVSDTTDTIWVYSNDPESPRDLRIKIDFFDDDYGSCSGIITDEILTPIPNSKIYFFYYGIYLFDSTFTDISGNYTKQLPKGDYTVAAEKEGYRVMFSGNTPDPYFAQSVALDSGQAAVVDIQLPPVDNSGYSISGTVIDSVYGNPINKGIVIVRKGTHTPTLLKQNALISDSSVYAGFVKPDGSYNIVVEDSTYYFVQAYSSYYLPTYYNTQNSASVFWQNADSVFINQTVTNRNLYLERDSSYGGGGAYGYISVPFLDGRSYDGITILAKSLANNQLYSYNFGKDDGRFYLNNLPYGTYQLVAQKIGFPNAVSNQFVISALNPVQNDLSIQFTLTDVVNEDQIIPSEIRLYPNYPNPFNPSTKISYSINSNQFVSIIIYDVLGKEIETLVHEEKPTGIYEFDWNAENLTSGVYFYQLRAGNFVETRKMILLK
ncbi:MAG TPA: T9SS type A sorting domain-containing protein [Ignavibacteriaceae bacterium]